MKKQAITGIGALLAIGALQGCGGGGGEGGGSFFSAAAASSMPAAPPHRQELQMTTMADGTRGNKGGVDLGASGPSQGDMFVFDQPLMDKDRKDIGTNSGYCIATRAGAYGQCQWTLTMDDGAVVVAGQEAEKGPSVLAVIGATGRYGGFTGEMTSVPNGDGTFTQELKLHRP
ncbi:hypothetical protein QFZ42_002240 [Variovorax paradoxus]|jgi:hypothetical protein|uniref:allene oxide cyclase barrel-like domain-containing protein n=1 Tax=Variovorax paradoxus TaxID=34073 RepID=UPI002791E77F|nr:hypothetical protein [Variovorax paradoxus]MDQ0570406.1 hypothetical protein [Variovorax paradoxus]